MNRSFLKPNVAVQPAFFGWYADIHMLAPATSAMKLANRCLKIMRSYVLAPDAHAAACRNPKMLGGPFADLEGGHVQEVRALIDRTVTEAAALLGFAAGIHELFQLLREHARGEP